MEIALAAAQPPVTQKRLNLFERYARSNYEKDGAVPLHGEFVPQPDGGRVVTTSGR